jgi:hypothetical protein
VIVNPHELFPVRVCHAVAFDALEALVQIDQHQRKLCECASAFPFDSLVNVVHLTLQNFSKPCHASMSASIGP